MYCIYIRVVLRYYKLSLEKGGVKQVHILTGSAHVAEYTAAEGGSQWQRRSGSRTRLSFVLTRYSPEPAVRERASCACFLGWWWCSAVSACVFVCESVRTIYIPLFAQESDLLTHRMYVKIYLL